MATPKPYDPATLLAALAPEPLRSVARRLGVDPAILCRPWSERQADRYATAVGLHPGEIWPDVYWGANPLRPDALNELRRPQEPWRVAAATRLAGADGTARNLRRAALLTLTEAAHRLGVSPQRLDGWERGRNAPTTALAPAYGAFLAELAAWVLEHADRIKLPTVEGSAP